MKTEKLVKAIVHTGNKHIGDNISIAATFFTRLVGLMGRPSLSEGEGLLLKKVSSFGGLCSVHMLFMKFAIDVIFLNEQNKIVHIAHRVRPWTGTAMAKAQDALELPAGTAQRLELSEGDVIDFS
ncbi:MAG: DUF192 domain-containing protein [Candidatus Lindowbacteria bacterium]|nr:DUF192 domain-containing protein [Candidatus Lindowbacteria bacterium]